MLLVEGPRLRVHWARFLTMLLTRIFCLGTERVRSVGSKVVDRSLRFFCIRGVEE